MPVTQEQIQAAISRKLVQQPVQEPLQQPAQQGVTDADIQAAIAKRQQGIVSEPLPTEQAQRFAGLQRDREIVSSARNFLNPSTQLTPQLIQNADLFTLLESVNQAKVFGDIKNRVPDPIPLIPLQQQRLL